MINVVVYQTDKNIGICGEEDWWLFCYENNIIPIRETHTQITKQALEHLLEILETDKELYIDILLEEINSNIFTTLYNN